MGRTELAKVGRKVAVRFQAPWQVKCELLPWMFGIIKMAENPVAVLGVFFWYPDDLPFPQWRACLGNLFMEELQDGCD